MTAPAPHLDSGYCCETGSFRDRNEDACLTLTADYGGHFDLPPLGLYVVADGMGGHDEGHVASDTAARIFAEYVLAKLYLPQLHRHPHPREGHILDVLERGVFAAHEAILKGNGGGNGGSTLTAALVLGRRAYVAHVGDSRAYLADENGLRLLTEDHSLVRRLQDRGELSDEDARSHEYRNVLLQALGQESALSADTFALDLSPGSTLLLCSDGLSTVVPDEELAAPLVAGRAQEAAERLVDLALQRGSQDNVTAVVVRVGRQ